MSDPRATWLQDQIEAALEDASGVVDGFARRRPVPSRTALAVVQQLVDRMIEQTVQPCAHLSPNAPSVLFWAPSLPGRLNCANCHSAVLPDVDVARRLPCDGCSAATRRWHTFTTFTHGRVIVPCFLCPACLEGATS